MPRYAGYAKENTLAWVEPIGHDVSPYQGGARHLLLENIDAEIDEIKIWSTKKRRNLDFTEIENLLPALKR